MNKNTLLYAGLIIFGLAGAFIFPAYKLQLSFLYILIVLAMTWDVQGGQMGYNTFGNILFFGIGMYVASSTQIAMFFSLSRMDRCRWRKNFCSYYPSIFSRFWSRNIISRNYSNNNCRSNWLWDFRFKRTLLCNLYFGIRNCCWRNCWWN